MSGTETPETPVAVVETPVEETPEGTGTTDLESGETGKLRKEAASYRVKLREQEQKTADALKKIAEFERSQLDEKQRLTLDAEEAKQKLGSVLELAKASFLEAAVAKQSRSLELADVDATIKLLDHSAIEYSPDGKPTNIEEVLGSTLERYPFLKTPTAPVVEAPVVKAPKVVVDPGSTNPGRSRNSNRINSRAEISAMSREERKERAPDIQDFLSRQAR